PGMLLHIDGSRHHWFQDDRWYDLLVILDDATSRIYYAQLVEEKSTIDSCKPGHNASKAARRSLA
ncbi:MAG: hypothetical protein WA197_10020, partial [Candidatus Acidiferrales bacterium]